MAPPRKLPDPPMTEQEMREDYQRYSSIATLYAKAKRRQPSITKDEIRRVIFGEQG